MFIMHVTIRKPEEMPINFEKQAQIKVKTRMEIQAQNGA